MHLLLIIVLTLISVIALLLIAGLFIKKEYALEKSITISKARGEVFDFIRLLKNQDHYNKWWRMDPATKKNYVGVDGTVGCFVAWEGNNQVGKGEQEIIKLTDGKRIDFEIRFEKPFEGVAHTYMTTDEFDGATTVTWGFQGVNKYPMNIPFALFGLRKSLEKDLYASLTLLKDVLEK